MHEDQPTMLRASIGSFMGFSRSAELTDDGTIVYERRGGGYVLEEHHERRPSRRAWSRFLRELDRLGVWNWQPEYFDPGACDGTQWELGIEHADRRIEVFGSNRYPDADGKPGRGCEATECFKQFCKAMSKLAGGDFR